MTKDTVFGPACVAGLRPATLHERFGFETVERTTIILPDGVTLAAVSMPIAIRGIT